MFAGDIIYALRYKDETKWKAAIARRDHFRQSLDKVFADVDAIALPVLRKRPYKLNWVFTGIFEARFLKIQTTMPASYAGVPALALPLPMDDAAFPVTSIQLVGPAKSEASLLNIGRLVE